MSDIFVFVYGSLRSGLRNSNYLSSSEYVGNFVSEKAFHMITYKNCGFPYLLEDFDIRESPSIVKGEIYKVSQNVLNKLDMLEAHPDIYQRKIHKFIGDYGIMEAWVYILVKHEIICYIKKDLGIGYKLIESGDWAKYLAE
jgi:gamma-glutamylcyclotransferase (GGCT)/AIG2-like uncharacterized protein YtfP